MKKLILGGLVVVGLNAYSLNITAGWQLLGAKSDINIQAFNKSNVVSVWAYDKNQKKWFAYLPNNPNVLDNYPSIGKLSEVRDGYGFWVNADSDINIDTQVQATDDNDTTQNIDVNTSKFDIFVNGVNNVNLTDIANKTFYMYSDEKIANFAFDTNGKADLNKFNGHWQLSYANGMILGINDNNETEAYKILASDQDVLALVGINSSYGIFADAWFYKDRTITPIDMSTITYPYTAYGQHATEYKVFTSDHKLETYRYNTSTQQYNKTDEKSFTIENKKIKIDNGESSYDWSDNNTTITTTSKYYETYQILKRVGVCDIWLNERFNIASYQDDNLKGKSWNDLINSDIVVYNRFKLGENGSLFVKNGNNFQENANYEYTINGNSLTITSAFYGSSFAYELDSTSGKVTSVVGHFKFIDIYSNNPIVKADN